MLSDSIPVFLNGRPARVPPGCTLGQLVAQEAPELAGPLESGQAGATDGRGVAVSTDTPVSAGAIFRVFRSARAASPPDHA